MDKLNSEELRNTTPTEEQLRKIKRNNIFIILEDVLDTYNVGAIFRLADAVGVKKIYLCGQTETPPNTRIKKASVNTWQWVNWEYKSTPIKAINELRTQFSNIKIVSVELDNKSVPYDAYEYTLPIALVVGHETIGISKETLEASDAIIELPMHGVNTSLNVMVSLGIVLYEVLEKTELNPLES